MASRREMLASMLGATALLMFVAAMASYIPARRAAAWIRVDAESRVGERGRAGCGVRRRTPRYWRSGPLRTR